MRFTRKSRILLQPTSLPGVFGSRNFGASSNQVINCLSNHDQTLYTVLPIDPIDLANCPYPFISAFAFNPLLICLFELTQNCRLVINELDDTINKSTNRLNYLDVTQFCLTMVEKASKSFYNQGNSDGLINLQDDLWN
jgi:4-alpha-glucanotransferase